MNGIEPIGRGNEKNARQIKGNIQVMIRKRIVLRRVQYFQKGRCRIPSKISSHFVQLVQEYHRISALHAPKGLYDPARQRANVSSAVSTDFCLVTHAAERDSRKLASQRIGNASSQ